MLRGNLQRRLHATGNGVARKQSVIARRYPMRTSRTAASGYRRLKLEPIDNFFAFLVVFDLSNHALVKQPAKFLKSV